MKFFNKLLIGGMVALGTLGQQAMASADFKANRTDFRDETIYFAMTTRFYDGDPKNNVLCWDGVDNQKKHNDPAWRGDFKGLIEKLDYIKALGFTAIWITPVVQNASGFDYHGYHAMDFSKVDLRYESRTEWGSSEDVDFQDLIDAAHAKDMKIVLDIVLQHTGNFGEDYLCHLFDRDQNIKTQAKITSCLIPDEEKLGGKSYWDLPNDGPKTQYSERFKYLKNTDGQNHDNKNYYHHVAMGWNWDDKSRWWGQIAGDCVDLNTENPAVTDYLIECYGKFIEMGVDGFRIDTTGHISRLTFNSTFIPAFIELGEKYKSKRLNQAPFYMFGECCSRYGGVVYRGDHALSSHFYTWKSPDALVDEFNGFTADWWANQEVPEGAAPLGNMLTCEKDVNFDKTSENVFMKDGAWHEPDYSEASGFNVIDFPVHYNFHSARDMVRIAKEGDHFYNDASFNVVYVDSHDYSPGPNDGVRFSDGIDAWAENLAMMFTFRGIPCIYYGSEVEFQKGVTIDKGPQLALAESGRAYFGAYLEGDVTATDFGTYEASGNVAQTLNADLAQHIRRLNQIRSAVPALRKGQYTWDGCTAEGGHAFKRAYKDSYALVAVNGGATFTDVPAGTYTDIVTGKTYNGGGTISVDAPATPGQLRVLVKDWTGGKVGEDGRFIYDTTPVPHGGDVKFSDPGTTEYYTAEDAPEPTTVAVKFSPNGGSFKSDTQTVTVTLSDGSVSGWYQIAGQSKVDLATGQSETFTIGADMNFGDTKTVSWSATGADNSVKTGSVTYKKVDPNAVITVYCKAASAPNLYAWTDTKKDLNGAWPGTKMSQTTTVNGINFYYMDFPGEESINIIFNNGSQQTGDITGITESVYYEYDGGSTATKLDIDPQPQPTKPTVTASPASGTNFTESIKVTLTVKPAGTPIHYTIDGSQPSASSATYSTPLTFTETTTLKTYVEKDGESNVQTFVYTKSEAPIPGAVSVYYDGKWTDLHIYVYNDGGELAKWDNAPAMTLDPVTGYYMYTLPDAFTTSNVIFKGNGQQHPGQGQPGLEVKGKSMIFHHSANQWVEYTPLATEDINDFSNALDIRVIGGQLVIYSKQQTTIGITSLTGQRHMINLYPGVNTIETLANGFYVVEGQKVMLNR